MSRRSRSAFTLVELLVVITVIAMLMALLIPTIGAMIEQGRRTQCLNNLQEINKATWSYEAQKQVLPPESTDIGVATSTDRPEKESPATVESWTEWIVDAPTCGFTPFTGRPRMPRSFAVTVNPA